jgi:hypothetical protein
MHFLACNCERYPFSMSCAEFELAVVTAVTPRMLLIMGNDQPQDHDV